jgi:hypothetical protein
MIYNVDKTSLKMTINTNKSTSTYLTNKNTLKEEISIFFIKCGIANVDCTRNFREVALPNQESERSCICVLVVMYLCVSGHVFVC